MDVRLPSIEELAVMTPTEREATIAAADHVRRQLETFVAEGVQLAEAQRQHRIDGHRTVTAWARASFNWSDATAKRVARNGRALAALPHLRAAARKGHIGVDQLNAFGLVHANPRCAAQLGASDAVLTDLARRHWFDDFSIALGRWEALADADGAARSQKDAHDDRSASIRIVGEEGIVRAQCGSADAVLLREILDRFTDAEFHADADDARARLGRPAKAADLERTHRQRTFDALRAALITAAAGAPNVIGPEPLVNIKLDQRTAEDLLRRAAGEDVADPSPEEFEERRCETVDGVRLSQAAALAALVIGRLRGYIAENAGVVIHLGRAQRLFRGGARAALILQDLRCLWPGCTMHTGRCVSDHTIPWDDLGVTDPGNGGRGCDPHNLWKTRGYRTVRRNDGTWDTYRPDGTRVGEHARPAAA